MFRLFPYCGFPLAHSFLRRPFPFMSLVFVSSSGNPLTRFSQDGLDIDRRLGLWGCAMGGLHVHNHGYLMRQPARETRRLVWPTRFRDHSPAAALRPARIRRISTTTMIGLLWSAVLFKHRQARGNDIEIMMRCRAAREDKKLGVAIVTSRVFDL